MIIFSLIVIAAAFVAAAWWTGSTLFAFVAIGVAALGLLALIARQWMASRVGAPAAGEPATTTVTPAEQDRSETEEASDGDSTAETAAGPVTDVQNRLQASHEDTSISAEQGTEEVPASEPAETPPSELVVHVIPGRIRFHRAGCRLLGEHEHEALTVIEAIEEGFTACSVCGVASDNTATKAS